jgi:hypothetical protein
LHAAKGFEELLRLLRILEGGLLAGVLFSFGQAIPEIRDSLTKTATELWKAAGAENDEHDHEDQHQLWEPKSEHVASENETAALKREECIRSSGCNTDGGSDVPLKEAFTREKGREMMNWG